jgi:hypothetical protein
MGVMVCRYANRIEEEVQVIPCERAESGLALGRPTPGFLSETTTGQND